MIRNILIFGFIFCAFDLPAKEKSRPNVLFIAIDDLNDWIGCLGGHPQVKTPHMDRLARRGMLFTNAHCQSPLCNPSRTSLLTGLRPSTTGIYGLRPWIRNVPKWKNVGTMPQHFTANGYSTMTTGKIFHGGYPPRNQRKREFQQWGPGAGVGARPKKKLVTTPWGNHPLVDWGTFPHKDEQKGDWQVASWAVDRLQEKPKEPFFLAVGFFLPHVPCYATQKWFDLYPNEDLVMPKAPGNDRDDTPEFSWYLHWTLPEPRLSWFKKAKQWQPIVRAYLACVSFVDSQVGRVLDALEKNKLDDNTIVVLWSDHGWHLGEKGISGKNSLWHESTRVPLIFAGPGVSNGICDQPVELLDLYPTLVEMCNLPKRDGLQGHSLVPQLKDPKAKRPWPAITTHNQGNHSIVTQGWRYIHYANGSEELYDLQKDPNEWKNLAKEPGKEKVLKEHQKWLPKVDVPPAPGSAARILEKKGDQWIWEGKAIDPKKVVK